MRENIFKIIDKNTCMVKNERYCITLNSEDEEREIYIKKGSSFVKVYKLIEHEEQIKRRINSANDSILDFSHCIITIDCDFSNKEFKHGVDFSFSIIDNIHFNESIFFEDSNFDYTHFSSKVEFSGAVFEKKANFRGALFDDECTFKDSVFKNYANFSPCIASSISFFNASFNTGIELRESKIKKLNFSKVTLSNESQIDFHSSEIDILKYRSTDFKNFKNIATISIFKEECLKNHDNINALKFYKKEMVAHKHEVKGIDWFILKVEECVSNFGTDPLRPLLIMFSISFIFAYFLPESTDSWSNYFSNIVLLLNPTSTISSILTIFDIKASCVSNLHVLEATNFLKNILFGILIYETIKSFRKFSRKL